MGLGHRDAPSVVVTLNMHRSVLRVFAIGCALALLVGPASLRAEDDFQTWHTLEAIKKINGSWELFVRPEIRIRNDSSQLFYHEYRQGVRWSPSKFLQIGLQYLFVRNATSGKPLEEHTGELDITPKWAHGPYEVSLRGRLAMKAIQRSSGEQEWQVRLMPKIAYTTTVAERKFTPYVADDLFYEYTPKAWNQNRVFFGVVAPLGATHGVKTSVDVYYMLQHQRVARDNWRSNHILGTRLIVRF